MSHHIGTHEIALAASGASVGTGFVAWFGANANAVGAMVAVCSLVVTIIFFAINLLLNRRNVSSKENIRRDVIEALIDNANEQEREIVKRLASK